MIQGHRDKKEAEILKKIQQEEAERDEETFVLAQREAANGLPEPQGLRKDLLELQPGVTLNFPEEPTPVFNMPGAPVPKPPPPIHFPNSKKGKAARRAAKQAEREETLKRQLLQELKQDVRLAALPKPDDIPLDEDGRREFVSNGDPVNYGISTGFAGKNPEPRGEFLYGTHSVLAALEAKRRQFHYIYHQETKDLGSSDESIVKVLRLAYKMNIPLRSTNKKALGTIVSDKVHNGLLLDCGFLPEYYIRAPAHSGERQAIIEEFDKSEAMTADSLRQLLFRQPLNFAPCLPFSKEKHAVMRLKTHVPFFQALDSSLLASLAPPFKQAPTLAPEENEKDEAAADAPVLASLEPSPLHSEIEFRSVTPPVEVPKPAPLEIMYTPFQKPEVAPLWIAIDRVVDHGNIGNIIRSAYFFNCTGILLGECSRLTAVTSKASAGAMEAAHIVRVADLARLLHNVSRNFPKEDEWRVVAMSTNSKATDLRGFSRDKPTIVVIGNEGEGLRPSIAAECTHAINIKTSDLGNGLDSLNVANATAVAIYQLSQPPAQALSAA